MILDFNSFRLNESSIKTAKKELRGVLNGKERKRMRELLRKYVVTFKFKKKNGEIRTAHGTLIADYLPKLRGGAPRPEHQMVYYDLDKGHWRSFRSYSFIKILNVKTGSGLSVVSSTLKHPEKSTSKPVTKSKYDEEEMLKKKAKETEEKEEKKVHKEDVEKKEVHKEEEKHIEHKEEHKKEEGVHKKESFKETEHDERDEHKEEKHKEEHSEHKEKDDEPKVGDKIPEDELKRRSIDFRKGTRKNKFTKEANDDYKKGKLKKDKEDEESKIDESLQCTQYPNVTSLGEGEFDGALWGHTFAYNGKLFYSEIGWKNIYPGYCKMTIKGNEAFPKQIDIYQRKDLIDLFKDEDE